MQTELVHTPFEPDSGKRRLQLLFRPASLCGSVLGARGQHDTRESGGRRRAMASRFASSFGFLTTSRGWKKRLRSPTGATTRSPCRMAGVALYFPCKVAGDSVESRLKDFKFTAVPYRREPTGNRTQYADYTLLQVLTESRHSHLRAQSQIQQSGNVFLSYVYAMGIIQTLYPQYASEGWVLTDGRRGFLVTKYSQEGMEWALLDRVPLGDERLGLRWGDSVFIKATRKAPPCLPRRRRIDSGSPASPLSKAASTGVLRLSRRDGSPGNGLPARFQSARALE